MALATRATEWLEKQKVRYTSHVYEYEAHGGTRVSSAKLGVDEHVVIKTLVFEDEAKAPLLVLMHGDWSVAPKLLASQLGKKSVQPCRPEVAERHTGYLVGGTSPFGTKKVMPIACEATIAELPSLLINGGRRGLLVGLDGPTLVRVLAPKLVSCARRESS